MWRINFTILLMIALSVLTITAAAQGPDRDAGEYLILSAQYGTERHHVDVTQQLREVARQDRLFRMDNRTFGVDPDPGVVKTLRIFARGPNGQERMFEYQEHSVIDGAQFRGWGRGEWGNGGWSGNWNGGGDAGDYLILSAQYGTERNHVDVTNRLRELARADRQFRMDNNAFGVDPDPGLVKTLRIFARGPNGQERMFEYQEHSVIDGAMFRGWGRGDWGNERWNGNWNVGGGDAGLFVILSAQYGTERHHVDVTDRLRELARADRKFRMGNSSFGIDPDHGVVKTLRIYARGPNGHERMFEYREGSWVDGAQFRGWGTGEWANGNDHWSGRWEGEEREERERERERQQ